MKQDYSYIVPETKILVINLKDSILNYSGAGGDGDILDQIDL